MGLLTDVVGRRRLVLDSVTVFSLAMIMCAIAPGVTPFGIGRVLVGFGVGGVVPPITALVSEYSVPQRRNVNTAVAFAGIGIGIGGAVSAVVARACASTDGHHGGRKAYRPVHRWTRLMTVMFWPVTFASLLVLFGIFTWLPHLMRSSGHELGSALIFLMVLNMGAVVGRC